MIKLDQTWSNWIKLDKIVETWEWGLVPHPYLILCLFIFDYLKTWLKLVMLENLQACLKSDQYGTYYWYICRVVLVRPEYLLSISFLYGKIKLFSIKFIRICMTKFRLLLIYFFDVKYLKDWKSWQTSWYSWMKI